MIPIWAVCIVSFLLSSVCKISILHVTQVHVDIVFPLAHALVRLQLVCFPALSNCTFTREKMQNRRDCPSWSVLVVQTLAIAVSKKNNAAIQHVQHLSRSRIAELEAKQHRV